MAHQNRLAKHYLAALANAPQELHEQGFEALLRYLDANAPMHQRLGYSISLQQDAFRLGQSPQLHFHASPFAEIIEQPESRQFKLKNVYWGLFGINGALPHHLTEYAIERQYRHQDKTLAEFCDIFHHRFISLFYRAWADAQPAVSHDHANRHADKTGTDFNGDHFARRVAVFAGTVERSDSPPDRQQGGHLNQYLAGLLSQKHSGAGKLEQALSEMLQQPVEIREFEGQWFDLPRDETSRLGLSHVRLGQDAMLGSASFQRSFNFSIIVGPLTYAQYMALLGNPQQFQKIHQLTASIVGSEYSYSIQLKLAARQKQPARLGQCLLGINSWMHSGSQHQSEAHIAYRQQYS